MNIESEVTTINKKILFYKDKGLKIFTSSSFQTHSIPLLHIISNVDNTIPVYFLNTGFHFPETLHYKNLISKLLNLNIIDIVSPISKCNQLNNNRMLMYTSDTNKCCFFNKTLPMQPLLETYDVWINGLRKSQSEYRATFNEEEQTPQNALRYHPIINWSDDMIMEYINTFKLPKHPLNEKGYFSIGCEPCTKPSSINDRKGRWAGQEKRECGLHIDLIKK